MKQHKNRTKKSNASKARELCIKAVAVMIEDYTEITRNLRYDRKEITAFAEGVARLSETARNQKHLAALIEGLDEQMAEQRVPLDERGTQLLKRVLKGDLPDLD